MFTTSPAWVVQQIRRYYDKVRVLFFVYVLHGYKTNECVCSEGGVETLKRFFQAREDIQIREFWKDASKVSLCCLSALPTIGLHAVLTPIYLLSPYLGWLAGFRCFRS